MNLFFRRTLAFFKRDFIEAASYKSAFLFGYFGILAHMVTFFFVAKVFGEGASEYLHNYGGDYFSFVLIGIALGSFHSTGLNSATASIGREQGQGTLEAILMTTTGLDTLILAGYFRSFLRAFFHVAVYLLSGAFIFNVDISGVNIPAVVLILLLTMTSLAGIGIFSAGFILVYKRGNPVNYFLNGASRFLSGVYFPISVLPLWVKKFSLLLPLTYALEAMRKAILKGEGILELGHELSALLLFSIILLPLGIIFFGWAVKRTRKEGSLVFY